MHRRAPHQSRVQRVRARADCLCRGAPSAVSSAHASRRLARALPRYMAPCRAGLPRHGHRSTPAAPPEEASSMGPPPCCDAFPSQHLPRQKTRPGQKLPRQIRTQASMRYMQGTRADCDHACDKPSTQPATHLSTQTRTNHLHAQHPKSLPFKPEDVLRTDFGNTEMHHETVLLSFCQSSYAQSTCRHTRSRNMPDEPPYPSIPETTSFGFAHPPSPDTKSQCAAHAARPCASRAPAHCPRTRYTTWAGCRVEAPMQDR